jgi:signal transduction histidine kinase
VEDSKTDKKSVTGFVRKRTLRATLEAVSQQMYARNKQLNDTNKMLSLLRSIDALALESHESTKVVSQQIADVVQQTVEYPLVVLFSSEAAHRGSYSLFGLSVGGYPDALARMKVARPPRLHDNSELLATDSLSGVTDITGYNLSMLAKELSTDLSALKFLSKAAPINAIYTHKLVVRQRLVGVLAIGFTNRALEMTESEKNLLDRLAGSIGVALDNKLLLEENQYVLKQLQRSNNKLKQLDEVKDEFLGMASHQLRTPLTSVKGFISMVLDGDVGPLTDQQRKVLEQAFESSQRMVFLIGDFLNVSRIQSGKFVIDKVPFDIVKLVHEEVNQLRDSAKARGLEFVYHPPSHMPEVYADRDKLRQVMMNFMDNALYYSPGGGKVTIRLYKDATGIVFKVSDTGIGVPKEEQEKLFTKFFRAKNAQQQRPDGTGIGLYMAKKVIVGHEGSLIFESKEGKGSTFGFHLPLENNLKKLEN